MSLGEEILILLEYLTSGMEFNRGNDSIITHCSIEDSCVTYQLSSSFFISVYFAKFCPLKSVGCTLSQLECMYI